MTRLVIIGAGGHGRVVAEAAMACGSWGAIEFLDARWPALQSSGDWDVVGADSMISERAPGASVIVAIGDCAARLRRVDELCAAGVNVANVIHPSAMLSSSARLGSGTVVLPGVVVNHSAIVGRAVILNSGAIVEHDCVLGDGVHVCPGVAMGGNVRVGARSWIGIGSAIKQGVAIGDDVVVGAGSVVVSDLPNNAIAFGVPARVRRTCK